MATRPPHTEPPIAPQPAHADPAPPADSIALAAEPNYPSRRTIGRWILIAVTLYLLGWILLSALPSLLPFIIGLVLAFILMPLVNRLDRRMPRWAAILTVYIGAILLIVVMIAYIAPAVSDQIEQLIDSFPDLINRLETISQDLNQQYQHSVPAAIRTPIEQGLRNGLESLQGNITTYLQSVGLFIFAQIKQIINTVTFLIGFLIIPIWLFYVMFDIDKGAAFIDRILHPRIRGDFWTIWNMINRVFSDYIRGQLFLGIAVGAMVGVGLLLLRLFGFPMGNYMLLLAIIAGITELIPVIGPIIGAVPGVIIGFTVSPATGLAVLLVYVVVQQLENQLLVPRIIGESVNIHPAILMVMLIAASHVFGILGAILAAPVLAIARDLFIYIYRRLDGLSPEAAHQEVLAHNTPAPAPAKAHA